MRAKTGHARVAMEQACLFPSVPVSFNLANGVSLSDATREISEMEASFSSRRRHTGCLSGWSSDVCSSDLFFRPELLRLLTLTAARIAQAIENARLYARVSRQAQTLDRKSTRLNSSHL